MQVEWLSTAFAIRRNIKLDVISNNNAEDLRPF